MNRQQAFTLAEILITITIVGTVAAMTLPTLITKINDKMTDNQTKVFNAKLIKGLNLTKTAGELNNTYTSTADFLENALANHLKINKICTQDKIRSCVPYDEIKYYIEVDNKTEDSVKISALNNVKILNLKESDGFKDIASFVMNDGTVVIGSYNLNCIADSGELDKEINSCFAGIYDLNGSRKPNKLGKDILTFNKARINKGVLAILGGIRIISTAQRFGGITTSEYCDTSDSDPNNWKVKPEYSSFITKCCTSTNCQDSSKGDWQTAAAIACNEMGGKLPDDTQLRDMANALYRGMNAKLASGYTYGDDGNGNKTTIGSNEPIPTPLTGLSSSYTYLMSGSASPGYSLCPRAFDSDSTTVNCFAGLDAPGVRAVCVAK